MRILYIAAGAAGTYCGACARDALLLRGLHARGHAVTTLPLYTPLKTDLDAPPPTGPVLYGGMNLYLQQVFPPWRFAPRVLTRWLDRPRFLEWISRFGLETAPQKLGPMTVSVLAGDEGRQARALVELLAFVQSQPRPDVIHITNSLLSAVGPALQKALGVPVVCSLQGEHLFLDAMGEPWQTQALDWIRTHAQAIDQFVSPGARHAETMQALLQIETSRIAVIPAAVDPQVYHPAEMAPKPPPFVIGYLSVIAPHRGLDRLVEVLIRLTKEGRDVRLAVAGRIGDSAYWKEIEQCLAANSVAERFTYHGVVDRPDKIALLQRCHAFSVPSRQEECGGVSVLEAMACGTPVVQPRVGIYPEWIEATGGGLLVDPKDTLALVDAFASLMDDASLRMKLSQQAAEGARTHFTPERMINETEALYRSIGAGVS